MSAVTAIFVCPRDLKPGESRAVRVTGLNERDTMVFLDSQDGVRRVRVGDEETFVPSWQMRQVLLDLLPGED